MLNTVVPKHCVSQKDCNMTWWCKRFFRENNKRNFKSLFESLKSFFSSFSRWNYGKRKISHSMIFFIFLLFRASLEAYGGSQARGRIRATTAGLHHSHSNVGSKPHLWPIPQVHRSQQCQMLNPLSEARGRTGNLMIPSQIHFHWATTGTPMIFFFSFLFVLYKFIYQREGNSHAL